MHSTRSDMSSAFFFHIHFLTITFRKAVFTASKALQVNKKVIKLGKLEGPWKKRKTMNEMAGWNAWSNTQEDEWVKWNCEEESRPKNISIMSPRRSQCWLDGHDDETRKKKNSENNVNFFYCLYSIASQSLWKWKWQPWYFKFHIPSKTLYKTTDENVAKTQNKIWFQREKKSWPLRENASTRAKMEKSISHRKSRQWQGVCMLSPTIKYEVAGT